MQKKNKYRNHGQHVRRLLKSFEILFKSHSISISICYHFISFFGPVNGVHIFKALTHVWHQFFFFCNFFFSRFLHSLVYRCTRSFRSSFIFVVSHIFITQTNWMPTQLEQIGTKKQIYFYFAMECRHTKKIIFVSVGPVEFQRYTLQTKIQ